MYHYLEIALRAKCYSNGKKVSMVNKAVCREGIRRSGGIQIPWPESATELYRLSNRRLSAKLVPTSADRGCHVVSGTDPYGRSLGFRDQSRYFFFQVAPQLYLRG
jgi:hypothetical protein